MAGHGAAIVFRAPVRCLGPSQQLSTVAGISPPAGSIPFCRQEHHIPHAAGRSVAAARKWTPADPNPAEAMFETAASGRRGRLVEATHHRCDQDSAGADDCETGSSPGGNEWPPIFHMGLEPASRNRVLRPLRIPRREKTRSAGGWNLSGESGSGPDPVRSRSGSRVRVGAMPRKGQYVVLPVPEGGIVTPA